MVELQVVNEGLKGLILLGVYGRGDEMNLLH